MSTLVTTNLKHGGAAGNNIVLNSDGSTTVSGALTLGTSPLAVPTGAAPSYTCRAWVNFDGTTSTGGFCTVRASGNVSSVADNGTGQYVVNFATAMPDTNYMAAVEQRANSVTQGATSQSGKTINDISIFYYSTSGTFVDRDNAGVAIFR
jgi:hypothetical protein